MADKILIEEYKGQSIYYEEFFDKFTCDVVVEDKYRKTKRNNLQDVRNEIDAFIKANQDFKPFKAIIGDGMYSHFKVVTITSVRKDGRLNIEYENGEKKHISPNQQGSDCISKYDVDAIDAYDKFKKKEKGLLEALSAEKGEIKKMFQPLDLSFIEQYK